MPVYSRWESNPTLKVRVLLSSVYLKEKAKIMQHKTCQATACLLYVTWETSVFEVFLAAFLHDAYWVPIIESSGSISTVWQFGSVRVLFGWFGSVRLPLDWVQCVRFGFGSILISTMYLPAFPGTKLYCLVTEATGARNLLKVHAAAL